MVLEPMKWKLAASQFDLGYTELFCVPEVISVFFSSCDSVFGDSLEFSQANRGSLRVFWENAIALHATQQNPDSTRSVREVSWVFSSCGRNLGYILELWRGCPLETAVCSVKSGPLSRYDGHLRNVNYTWQGNMDASGSQGGDQVSFSSWHSDVGIPINFHEESGIITF